MMREAINGSQHNVHALRHGRLVNLDFLCELLVELGPAPPRRRK